MKLKYKLIGTAIAVLVMSLQPTFLEQPVLAATGPSRAEGQHGAPPDAKPTPLGQPVETTSTRLDVDMPYKAYIPRVVNSLPDCPVSSSSAFETIAFQGGPYKDNRLTDENADFRMSILGYSPNPNAVLGLVTYNGTPDSDAPRLHTIFTPARVPAFVQVSTINQWNWNESAPPPYGTRGSLNTDWDKSTVLTMRTTNGESLNVPARNAPINSDYKAMVLYASENELTVAYFPYDHVLIVSSLTGYAVHMQNFCVDPNLVALYRAQLSNGKRSTMRLPVVRSFQRVGWARGNAVTVAIRDGARYMDPRSAGDWWAGHP
jgi:hypothetical protein